MRWSGALILLGNEPNSFALMYVKPFATRNLQTQHFGDLQKHRSENVLVKQTCQKRLLITEFVLLIPFMLGVI